VPDQTAKTNVAVVLERENLTMSHMPADMPGSPKGDDLGAIDAMVDGIFVKVPVDPKRAMDAVASSGELAAVVAAVADGCAGATYLIRPRSSMAVKRMDLDDPSTWSPDVVEQHRRLQVFVQVGFQGKGAQSLRQGFQEQEHDRAVLGWGGVTVTREVGETEDGLPMRPRALGRFYAAKARFTKPQAKATLVPIPVSLMDGSCIWVEEPRHFRRIGVDVGNGRIVWYKQYGDWRAMDANTGKYSKSSRRLAPLKKGGAPAFYRIGALPPGSTPAVEVMHWSTTFPNTDPYGRSAWHSEMRSVDVSRESLCLLLEHLKSGLHGVILAAANRPFDDASAGAAINKIDELGRGRKGMGSLITIGLSPVSSGSQGVSASTMFDRNSTADRGRLVLHELNTKLPKEVMDGSLRSSAGTVFAHSERVPAILLGKSDSYNFATASAAWEVANRLRFGPHHEDRTAFLSRLLIEMGITFWTVEVRPSDWSEDVPVAGISSVVGQNAGMTPNEAVRLMSKASGLQFKPFEEWWGEVPMPLLTVILNNPDPAAILRLIGLDEVANRWKPSEATKIIKGVSAGIDAMNATAEQGIDNRLKAAKGE
jgi:hypothetical protein